MVDDSPVNREVAREALCKLGLRVEEAASGREALEAVSAKRYDVVFMDGSMPDLDGFEACRRIRASEAASGGARVPIVALTAHVAGKARDAWREAGMDAVLYKPFTLAALGQCLAQINPAFASGAQTMDGLPHSEQTIAASETDLLDPAMLVQLEQLTAQGRSEFVQRVCALYLEHAPKCGEDIDRALAQNDLENLRRAAHALKSMSNNIGANVLGRLCADVECATLEEQQDTQLQAKCRSLATTLQATLVALQEYLKSRSANEEPTSAVASISPITYLEPHYRLIEQEIAEGLRRSEFELAYQPLVDPTGQHTLGVEALVRWNRAPRNPMSPDRFIPIAEKTGQIVELGQWILAKACDDAKAWPEITIAVNVSTVQLQRQDFAPSLRLCFRLRALIRPGSNWRSPRPRGRRTRKASCAR